MAPVQPQDNIRTGVCIAAAHGILRRHSGPGTVSTLAPPVPVEELARMLGFQVVDLAGVPDEFSALVALPLRLIGVNAGHHAHRRRFSIGHELGHVLLHHPPECRCTARQVRLFDREADLCASEMLMPSFLVCKALKAGIRRDRLPMLFGVSPEAMNHRLERLSPSPGPSVD